MLWKALYHAATSLADIHRQGYQDVEDRFRRETGWEMALREGAQTHAVAAYMNQRRDTYDGREILVEPHVKFPRSALKTGAKYQRLYYAYDAQTRKIIVGCVGDHLENYSTLSIH